jgi:hypothetical protein
MITTNQRQAELLDLHIRRNVLSHVYLFTGPRHAGKMAISLRVISSLLCDSRPAGVLAACGTCNTCKMNAAGTHPDVSIYNSEVSGETVCLNDIKRLRGRVATTPHGRTHIFLVRDVSRMTREAANALLKVLEEPKSDAVFLLLAEHADDVLGTIRSRAWCVRFWPTWSMAQEKFFTDKAEQKKVASVLFGTVADRLQYADEFRDHPNHMRLWYTKASAVLAGTIHDAVTRSQVRQDVFRAARVCHTLLDGEAKFLKPYATKRILFEAHLLDE